MTHTAPTTSLLHDLSHLRDTELVCRLDEALAKERLLGVEIITYLAEIERRQLHLAWAYSSMHDYCVRGLHMSDARAYRRVAVARQALRFPMLLEMLKTGELHLTAAAILAPHLNKKNCPDVLSKARFKSKRQVEDLAASLNPKPDAKPVIRRLPDPSSALDTPIAAKASDPHTAPRTQPTLTQPIASHGGSPQEQVKKPAPFDARKAGLAQHGQDRMQPPEAAKAARETTATKPVDPAEVDKVAPPAVPSSMQPLGKARYRVHFTISALCKEKLEHAQALLSHQVAGNDPAPIIERALDLLIETTMKQRFACKGRVDPDIADHHPATNLAEKDTENIAVTQPDPKRGLSTTAEALGSPPTCGHHEQTPAGGTSDEQTSPRSRHIPHAVRRQVVARDGLQCAYVDKLGRRCPQRRRLEFHHIDPYAKGGLHRVSNVTLRCKAHNQFHAQHDYGELFMAQRVQRARMDRVPKDTCASGVRSPHPDELSPVRVCTRAGR